MITVPALDGKALPLIGPSRPSTCLPTVAGAGYRIPRGSLADSYVSHSNSACQKRCPEFPVLLDVGRLRRSAVGRRCEYRRQTRSQPRPVIRRGRDGTLRSRVGPSTSCESPVSSPSPGAWSPGTDRRPARSVGTDGPTSESVTRPTRRGTWESGWGFEWV